MSLDAKLQNIKQMSDTFTAQMNEVTNQIKEFQEKIGTLFIPFELKIPLSEIDGVKWDSGRKVFDYYRKESVGRVSCMKKHGQILSANLDARKRFLTHFDEIVEVISEKYSTLHLAQEDPSEDMDDESEEEVREVPFDKIDNQIFSRKMPPQTVRDQFKLQAKQMVEDKRASGCDMRISTALNILSKQAGYKDWNTCSAMLRRLEANNKLKPELSEPVEDNESFGNR